MNERKLTLKQQKFVDYYIETGNATESAIKAGYSRNTASETGYENLTKPHLSIVIEERMNQMASERIADATEVLETLTDVMRGKRTGTALVSVGNGKQQVKEVKPTVLEIIRAAENLGKRYKLFTDKAEIEVQGAVQFIDDLGEDDED